MHSVAEALKYAHLCKRYPIWTSEKEFTLIHLRPLDWVLVFRMELGPYFFSEYYAISWIQTS